MEKAVRTSSVIILFIVLIGCGAQKSTIKSEANIVDYEQALTALDNGKFIIEANEFHIPRTYTEEIKYSTGSFITMQNNRATLNFSQDLFPRSPLSNLLIDDAPAKIIKVKTQKNGDIEYKLDIDGSQYWTKRRLLITLYSNTNSCYVQIYGRYGYDNSYILSFKGHIYPKAD